MRHLINQIAIIVLLFTYESHAMLALKLRPPTRESPKAEDPRVHGKTHSGGAQKIAHHRGYALPNGKIKSSRHRNSLNCGKTSVMPGHDGEILVKFYNRRSERHNKEAYEKDYASFANDRSIINDYIYRREQAAKKSNKKYSILTKIYGYESWDFKSKTGEIETTYACFLQKAEGKTLEHLLKDSSSSLDLEAIFYNVGLQLGNTLTLYYDDKFTITHPDSHMNNFIYNTDEDQLYWIDISRISTKSRNANARNSDELNLLLFTRDMPKLAHDYALGKIIDKNSNIMEPNVIHAQAIMRAHQALFKGFKEAMKNYPEGTIKLKDVFKNNPYDSDSHARLTWVTYKKIDKAIKKAAP